MTIELLKQKDENKWDDFVSRHPDATFYHQIGYKKVIEKTFGHQSYYFGAWEIKNQKLVGILPLFRIRSRLFKNSLISLPFCNYGGVLAKTQEVKKALIKKARQILRAEKLDFFELRYLSPQKLTKTTRLDKVTLILNLEKSEEKMFAKLTKKVRNYIRRAKKAGLKAKWGGPELINDFYQPFSYNLHCLGSPVLPKNYFLNLEKIFRPKVKFIVIYKNKKPIAGACLTFSRDQMEIPYSGAMWKKYERSYPNMLLYWECIRMAIGRQIKYFDLGRSTKDSSNYAFKRRWHAEPIQLYYQQYSKNNKIIDLTPRNPKFRLLIKIWRCLPLWLANFLGPKIVKGLG